MNKCKHYPNCDCYKDWVSPALKIVSESEAEFFALLMQEIKNFCSQSEYVVVDTLKPFLLKQIEVLPKNLLHLFSECTIKLIDFHFSWKMLEISDIKRLQIFFNEQVQGTKNNLKSIFKPEYYFLCFELFKELEFIDTNDNTKLQIKANEILGLVVALKETSHNLLNDNYTDDQLMEVFQKHLKISYTPLIKRRGKGYELTKIDAKNIINKHMKKARAS